MSSCYIIEFRDNKPTKEIRFPNSWRGAARIWSALFDKYIKDPNIPYDNWLSRTAGNDDALWQLVERDDLPEFERAVMAGTFDYATIARENFKRFAADLRAFDAAYPSEASHLGEWASFIEQSDADAVGFWCTSVCENPWCLWNEEADETVLYDLSTGEKHFEVYEQYLTPTP